MLTRHKTERGPASGVFSIAPFLGPAIGPIVGGFLGEAGGWVWVEGCMAIFTGVLLIACCLFVPETYAPVILRRRAAKLSKMTGKCYLSKMDVNITTTKAQQIKTALSRPTHRTHNKCIFVYGTITLSCLNMGGPSSDRKSVV